MYAKFAILAAGTALLSACVTSAAPQTGEEMVNAATFFPETVNVAPVSEWLSTCEKWDEWDKPGPAYRIHGDTYYVGTCGIAAIFVAGDQSNGSGHILIDTGTEAGAEVVLDNIRSLGFRPEDVVIILHSHEHFDHVGGMARMLEVTGAGLVSSTAAENVFETGEADPRDPQFGMHDPMTPVEVQFSIDHPVLVDVGGPNFLPIATPGHTPGALSWQWESCEDGNCKTIIYADSLSPVSSDDYRFSDHPEYLAAYRAGLDNLAAAKCDILITPHPSSSNMVRRLESGEGMEDSEACIAYAAHINGRIDKRLAEEAEAANGG